MKMLVIHAALWCVGAVLAILCAVVAFKRKWYKVGIVDVGVAFIDLAAMLGVITNYFAN